MANVNGKAPSVELSDALQAGFHDAMERVDTLKLDPCATLVDHISPKEWATWDASQENPLVVDSDGINGDDVGDDFDIAA